MPTRRFLFGSVAILAAMGCGRADPRVFGQGGGGGTTTIRGAFGNTEIALGDAHTCSRSVYGDVACWGDNTRSQLGKTGIASSNTPIAVTLPARARSIAAGGSHTCAVLEDERVFCWGKNGDAEVTAPASAAVSVPQEVQLPAGQVLGLSLGGAHTCVLLRDMASDSTLYCWGRNAEGQVGTGTPETPIVAPRQIALHVREVSAGDDFSVGIFKVFKPDGESDAKLTGWGTNNSAQLGFLGPPTNTPMPSDVLGLSHIAAGPGLHACALFDGQGSTPGAYCWGDNIAGELGRATAGSPAVPGPVTVLPMAVTAISPGYRFTCALAGGSVFCWGQNDSGQLGNGTTIPTLVPATTPTLTNARAVAAGIKHACAVVSDTDIECWGDNSSGELGDGTTMSRPSPVSVVLPK